MPLRMVVPAGDRLGEGPCWSPLDERLYWFDIKGRRLHWLDAAGVADEVTLPFRASAAAARAGGGLLMATDAGLATFDPVARQAEVVRPMSFEPGFRTNDGKVDPLGRFWWSTMDDNGGERPGAIFVTRPDLSTEPVLSGVHIANAISFSADAATLYLADSRARTIFRYQTADISSREVFASPEGPGSPDGAAMDAEGFLWNAEWGGWRVVRYSPDGSVDQVVEVPVEQPTSCVFGGPNLATLYVTSAWDGLSQASREEQPLAGALFAFEPGVAGSRIPEFAA
jgi:sugar lactone lactonase YvrE